MNDKNTDKVSDSREKLIQQLDLAIAAAVELNNLIDEMIRHAEKAIQERT